MNKEDPDLNIGNFHAYAAHVFDGSLQQQYFNDVDLDAVKVVEGCLATFKNARADANVIRKTLADLTTSLTFAGLCSIPDFSLATYETQAFGDEGLYETKYVRNNNVVPLLSALLHLSVQPIRKMHCEAGSTEVLASMWMCVSLIARIHVIEMDEIIDVAAKQLEAQFPGRTPRRNV